MAFAVLGLAKLLAISSMRARAAHVGFSVTAYRAIGVLELVGASGLALSGPAPRIATAAAVGLGALMVGAVTAHVRAGDGLKEATPALALSGALLALLLL